jgi:hypothetical protein
MEGEGMKYRITLSGCDDETEFEVECDDCGEVLLMELARKSKEASTYQ